MSKSEKSNSQSFVTTKPTFHDYVSLWLTTLSKMWRRHLQSEKLIDLENFYEQFFADKDIAGWSKDERRNVRRKIISDYLTRYLPEGASALDIGCGFGEVLLGMPESYRLFGMDYSQSNVRAAQKLLGDKAVIKQGNIYKIPYKNESQDVCLCLEVLEHIEDDARGIREIARVLKPEGILIAAVPYSYYWPQYKELIGHFRHYTRQNFDDLLRDNGLFVRDYLPNYPNWHVAYARSYCRTRFLSIVFGPLVKRRDVFEFKWPWSKQPLLQKVAQDLRPLLEKDGRIPYALTDTSTFIVAQRI